MKGDQSFLTNIFLNLGEKKKVGKKENKYLRDQVKEMLNLEWRRHDIVTQQCQWIYMPWSTRMFCKPSYIVHWRSIKGSLTPLNQYEGILMESSNWSHCLFYRNKKWREALMQITKTLQSSRPTKSKFMGRTDGTRLETQRNSSRFLFSLILCIVILTLRHNKLFTYLENFLGPQ